MHARQGKFAGYQKETAEKTPAAATVCSRVSFFACIARCDLREMGNPAANQLPAVHESPRLELTATQAHA